MFEGQGSEAPHLLAYTQQVGRNPEDQIMRLNARGQTLRQIATQTNMPTTSVYRVIQKIKEASKHEV